MVKIEVIGKIVVKGDTFEIEIVEGEIASVKGPDAERIAEIFEKTVVCSSYKVSGDEEELVVLSENLPAILEELRENEMMFRQVPEALENLIEEGIGRLNLYTVGEVSEGLVFIDPCKFWGCR